MSVNFIQDLPIEIPVRIVYHSDAPSTSALTCTCKRAVEIIKFAAGSPQKEISLSGARVDHLDQELTVTFDIENQTITVLLKQKKKIDLLTRNPNLFHPINIARTGVINGYHTIEDLFDNMDFMFDDATISPPPLHDPNDLQELCNYAKSTKGISTIVPLILFDVTAKKVHDYDLKNTLMAALDYPEGLALIQIIIHHAKQQKKHLRTQDICDLLIKAAIRRKTFGIQIYQPNPIPKLISLLKARKPEAFHIAGLLKEFIKINDQKLCEEMLSFPIAVEIEGEDLGDLLKTAIESKDPTFIQTILLHPHLNRIPTLHLAQAILNLIKTNQLELAYELFSLRNAQENDGEDLRTILIRLDPDLFERMVQQCQ